jgi:hypothetical protein
MSYSFQPLSDNELNAINLVEDGEYEFEVVKSTRKTSRAGNPMAELQIKFWDKMGMIHTVYDYLVFSTVPLNIRKVKHFCEAVGLDEEYKSGSIPEELSGYTGEIKISTDPGQEIPEDRLQGKPKGSKYPSKNVVDDYIKGDGIKKMVEKDNLLSDDVPF